MDTINKVENVTSREKERERTSKANIDRAINDKLTSSRNGLLVKHALKNIKKTGKSHGVERRCSRFSAIFDGEIGVAVHVPKRGGKKSLRTDCN